MATQWGMSDKLGPLKYTENQEEVFLGHSVTRSQNVSEETSRLIDSEVRAIVTAGYDRAKQLLTDHIDQLHAIAGALLEYETLTGDEIRKVMDGGTIDRGTTTTPVARPSASASAIPKAGRRGTGPSPGVGEAPAGA